MTEAACMVGASSPVKFIVQHNKEQQRFNTELVARATNSVNLCCAFCVYKYYNVVVHVISYFNTTM